MTLGKPDSNVSRYETRCGTIMEGCLTEFEHSIGRTYCPTKCPTCGTPHGWQPFKVLAKDVRLWGAIQGEGWIMPRMIKRTEAENKIFSKQVACPVANQLCYAYFFDTRCDDCPLVQSSASTARKETWAGVIFLWSLSLIRRHSYIEWAVFAV